MTTMQVETGASKAPCDIRRFVVRLWSTKCLVSVLHSVHDCSFVFDFFPVR